MEIIAGLIVQYASIWTPALTAVIGIIVLLVSAFSKITTAVNESKETIKEVKNDQSFKDLAQEIKEQKDIDRMVMKAQNVLIDRITKIENYMEAKEREENGHN